MVRPSDTPFLPSLTQRNQLDKLVGLAMLIIATTVFLYYTTWTLLMVDLPLLASIYILPIAHICFISHSSTLTILCTHTFPLGFGQYAYPSS